MLTVQTTQVGGGHVPPVEVEVVVGADGGWSATSLVVIPGLTCGQQYRFTSSYVMQQGSSVPGVVAPVSPGVDFGVPSLPDAPVVAFTALTSAEITMRTVAAAGVDLCQWPVAVQVQVSGDGAAVDSAGVIETPVTLGAPSTPVRYMSS